MASTVEQVCIVGSGNWGSAIARVIGENVKRHDGFNNTVRMWVHDELVNGVLLSTIINSSHENVKYLPGVKLPSNVVAEPDLLKAVEGCAILVIVVPHQFVQSTLKRIGKLPPNSKVISLVKGIDSSLGLSLFSDVIQEILGAEVSVLMGANVADEVARGLFCEATIASRIKEHGKTFKMLFNSPSFQVDVTDDVVGTQLCGALKNVVALAAGFCDGLGLGSNTKAAIIRIGLIEMKRFANTFYEGVEDQTFLESCGVGDLITTCYNGRNRRLAEVFVKSRKSFEALEKELLNGQHLQGPLTALEVNHFLKKKLKEKDFPLFTAVYKISFENMDPSKLIDELAKE